ncbi:MAG TPA: nucleotidyltransferase [Pyrinomonadaceae bacterium]|nr:nucleotidyltransferase [Pyrinomonadaceae bacterium]
MTTAANTDARSVSETYEEGLRYFMGSGSVNRTLERLASDLKSHNIDYVVIGAVALLAHGYPRFTEDIDLVMTHEGLEKFHRELIGLGYAPAFPQAKKRLRATEEGLSIDVMLAGEYPGDGKQKPVTMPDPKTAAVEIDGVRFVTLEKLIELKLASGMTAPDRLKDLADVQELIKVRQLQTEFAERLDPYVRNKFLELCDAVKQSPKD